MRYLQSVNGLNCPLRHHAGALTIGFGQQNRKFPARIAAQYVRRPMRHRAQNVGHGFQASIARLLAQFGVKRGEAFDIRQQKSQRRRGSLGAQPFLAPRPSPTAGG